jgi:hypothetical protein
MGSHEGVRSQSWRRVEKWRKKVTLGTSSACGSGKALDPKGASGVEGLPVVGIFWVVVLNDTKEKEGF